VWLLRLLYTIALHFDAIVDWTVRGVTARYPELAPPDALPALGRERGIRRGFSEAVHSYRARLMVWLVSRKSRGNAYALMDQLAGYMSPNAGRIRVVNANGHWFTREPDGTRAWSARTPSNWIWDLYYAAWSRYWVIIYPPTELWTTRRWGGGHRWGSAAAWGSTILPEQARALREVVAEWNPPHAACWRIVLAFDSEVFDPALPAGAGNPNGDYYYWHKDSAAVAVRARDARGRYCAGSF
jgi:hypothetical protein